MPAIGWRVVFTRQPNYVPLEIPRLQLAIPIDYKTLFSATCAIILSDGGAIHQFGSGTLLTLCS